ncbi:hypothetical protein chiPu_0021369, partial [Chiloscyllium punctatum]|nr:hypothetical protein [Chiloscyllium punctatum]
DKLTFPPDISDVSEAAQDLIAKLVCGKDRRLGQAGIRDLQGHPFFTGINWQHIRECPPPYIPEVTSPTDTSNFDVDDDVLKLADSTVPSSRSAFSGLHLPFVGFTYTSNCSLSDRGCLRDAWGSTSLDNREAEAFEIQIKQLEVDKRELNHRLQESLQKAAVGHSSSGTAKREMEIKSLKEEMQILKTRLAENQLDNDEQVKRKSESENRQLRALEKQLKTLKQEKEEIYKLEAKMEEQALEVAEQSQLRERSEQRRRQLEEELERLKLPQTGADPSSRGPDPSRELAEVEGRALAREEELARQHSAQAAELKVAREQLEESESRQQRLERELVASRERLEKARSERQSEQEELVMELRAAHEQEKNQLREENLRLNVELEPLMEKLDKLQARNKRLEEELQALEGRKETVKQWDTQIAEIIQWVSEEKEARGYLQSLATKMTEELDSLKSISSNAKPVDTHWKVRRLQKLEASAKLELQSALDAEIRAKQSLQEQLNEAKLTNLATEW